MDFDIYQASQVQKARQLMTGKWMADRVKKCGLNQLQSQSHPKNY